MGFVQGQRKKFRASRKRMIRRRPGDYKMSKYPFSDRLIRSRSDGTQLTIKRVIRFDEITAATSNTFGLLYFVWNGIQNFADLASIWSEYRVDKIILRGEVRGVEHLERIEPYGLAAPMTNPYLALCPWYEMATSPSSMSEILQHPGYRLVDMTKGWKYPIKPVAVKNVQLLTHPSGGGSVIPSLASGQWWRTGYTDNLKHIGLAWGCSGTDTAPASFKQHVYGEVWISLRNQG